MPTITNLPPGGAPVSADNSKISARKSERADVTAAPGQPVAAATDALVLSGEVEATMQEAEFDQRKVDQLRDAISRGAYPLDPMRITEKFIELEKLL
jgi:flagellar biosynthesis anti-sigma factor FlgM